MPMNEVEYERMQEVAGVGEAIAANLHAILADYDAEGLPQLARSVYRYTTCGAWVAAVTHDGRNVPGDSLGQLALGSVRSLLVGSIVEGVDETVEPHAVDLAAFDEPEAAVAAFAAAVEAVEDAARAIWMDTHGCESCRAMWRAEGREVGDDLAPVRLDCPDCGGDGVVL